MGVRSRFQVHQRDVVLKAEQSFLENVVSKVFKVEIR